MALLKINSVKVLAPARITKRCSCGKPYPAPPHTAIVADYGFGLFFQFDCTCKSTLMWPIEVTKVAA